MMKNPRLLGLMTAVLLALSLVSMPNAAAFCLVEGESGGSQSQCVGTFTSEEDDYPSRGGWCGGERNTSEETAENPENERGSQNQTYNETCYGNEGVNHCEGNRRDHEDGSGDEGDIERSCTQVGDSPGDEDGTCVTTYQQSGSSRDEDGREVEEWDSDGTDYEGVCTSISIHKE